MTSSTQARLGWRFPPGDSEMEKGMELEEGCWWMNCLENLSYAVEGMMCPAEDGQRVGREHAEPAQEQACEQYSRGHIDYQIHMKMEGIPPDQDIEAAVLQVAEYEQGKYGWGWSGKEEASVNHPSADENMNDELEFEALCLMQASDDSQAWYSFLEALRLRFDSMDKFDRAVHTSFLLRKLNWHATDSANGYLLGHMGGRTAQMTALLVAYQDNVEVDTEAPVPTLAAGAWAELENFLPAHPGSMRSQGMPLPLEEPCVMLSMREVPSEFLTPGYDSPTEDKVAAKMKKRKQSLMLEVSSGSADCQVTTRRVRVPLINGEADLRFHFKIQNDTESETSETVPASSVAGVGTTLSVPAPQNLGEAGLSLVELWRMEAEWRAGTSREQLVQTYGWQVVEDMIESWRTGQGAEACPGGGQDQVETEGDSVPCRGQEQAAPVGGVNQETEERDGDPDEVAMISLHRIVGVVGGLLSRGADVEQERPSLEIIREHLHRQRGQGMTVREQASTIYHLMESRGCQEYMAMVPRLLEEVGLEVDVDLSVRCLPGPTPFMVWVETEMWEEFVDYYEGTMGHESEGLQALRGQETLTDEERRAWRRWAGTRARSPRHGRSRSPRGASDRTARGTVEHGGAREAAEDQGDVASFMHKGGRRDSRDPRGGRRRHWRDEGAGRDRSRERRANDRGGAREERIRQRVTREIRHLGPAGGCWAEWGDGGGARDRARGSATEELASASTAPRRTVDRTAEEMDVLQATGEWFVILGLRNVGEEQMEPSNAITKERQARARTLLTGLSERDLGTMVRALLRLTGMLYIEAARLVTQVQDARRRNTELVEVEVEEDDDESIYMQGMVMLMRPRPWEDLLQQLVAMADRGADADAGLLAGLRRRIDNSLFLQTPQGRQLQAVLIAAGTGNRVDLVACETEENDGIRLEEWWAKLKSFMQLGGEEESSARGSDEVLAAPEPRVMHTLANPAHAPGQVEEWETERLQLQREQEREREQVARELRDREAEVERQEAADLQLFEQHEGERFKDWENWLVLNTPNRPKRRRLVVTTGQPEGDVRPAGSNRAELWVPGRLDTMRVTMHLETVEDLPAQREEGNDHTGGGRRLEWQDDRFQRVYETWKAGDITNQGVISLYGDDWLMLFEVTRDGPGGGDTLLSGDGPGDVDEASAVEAAVEEGPMVTQLDDGSHGGSGGRGSGWGERLREEDVMLVREMESLLEFEGDD